jgi:biotin carboxyl carrier protein
VLGTSALTWFVWYRTWFGARLGDDALIAAMQPTSPPRDVMHGIHEITVRLTTESHGLDRWARLLVDASRRGEDPVRNAAAWAMGTDATRPEFLVRLHELVAGDASVLVRRNAACSLAKARDPAGRAVLRSMLEPFPVTTSHAGAVASVAAVEMPVREENVVARIRLDDGTTADVLSPVPGRVVRRAAEDGARVASGDAIVVLAPDSVHALQAAMALSLVGTADDVELLSLAAAPQSDLGDDVKKAANAAVEAIRSRGK